MIATTLGLAVAAAAAAVDPEMFVAGWPIEAPAGAEVFDLPLPAEVYAAGTIEQLAVDRGRACGWDDGR